MRVATLWLSFLSWEVHCHVGTNYHKSYRRNAIDRFLFWCLDYWH